VRPSGSASTPCWWRISVSRRQPATLGSPRCGWTDQYIAAQAQPGDLVVTQDVPLAAQLVPMEVVVLDPRGEEHTTETIGERLSVRDFMDALRMAGAVTGGPRPYDARAKQAFAAALDRALARLTRRG
jgi:uncharacterized protein